MKLIVISNPININNEHKILCSLFENGLQYFHLRKPNFSLNEMEEYIEQIPSKYLDRIVLHSYYSLLDKYNLKGKHKTTSSISLNTHLFISTSFHSLEEIRDNTESFEYAFLSPVYDSISKSNYKSNFDRSELKTFFNTHKQNIELIALGGINAENMQETIDLGFSGVALLGAIWENKNPENVFSTILKNIYVS
jgi:thiamine-phosphate pyrophosphorylase